MSAVRTGDDRLVALAEAGRRLAVPTTLEELYPLAAELALDLLDASSASLARVENDRGVLRVLRNVGDLADWEEVEPVDEVYEIADFPLLGLTVDGTAAWVGDLGDPQTGEAHRELLQRMGMVSSISLPLIVHNTVWGEVGAARAVGLPSFGAADIAAGEAYCGLLSAALTRIAERDQLLDLAYRDALTGLGNRRAVDEHLEALLAPPVTKDVAVVICDVDGLKLVNDTYGHDAGDLVLREVGSLLTRMASTVVGCFAARLGGDEFCLLIEEQTTAIDLQRLTDRLTEEGSKLPMGAGLSCGWARATSRSVDPTSPREASRALLRLADAAQYRAKRAGRDAFDEAELAPPEPVDPDEVGARVVGDALVRLAACGDRLDDRLEAIACAFADVVDAAGWCVSVSVHRGPLIIVSNQDARRVGASDGASFEPGTAFELDDYPATSAALRGGSFHATLASGDDAERQFLARNGYDEIIAAGIQVDEEHAWLLEVFGDALSVPLAPHRGLLRALVCLALAESEDLAPPGWIELQDVGSTAC